MEMISGICAKEWYLIISYDQRAWCWWFSADDNEEISLVKKIFLRLVDCLLS